MPAGEAANPVVLQLLVETGICFADTLIEDSAQGWHGTCIDSNAKEWD